MFSNSQHVLHLTGLVESLLKESVEYLFSFFCFVFRQEERGGGGFDGIVVENEGCVMYEEYTALPNKLYIFSIFH